MGGQPIDAFDKMEAFLLKHFDKEVANRFAMQITSEVAISESF